MKIKKYKYQILLVLVLISLLSSLILSFIPTQEFCEIGKENCNVVRNSPYNYTFGIKNSYYGIVIFLFLSILIYFQIKKPDNIKRNIIHLGIIFGSIVAIIFLYIQEFILNAYCEYCMIVDISMLIALIVTLSSWKK